MIVVGDVELPKTNATVSPLEEQTIPLTVCWVLMPIRLCHVPFPNTSSNSLIAPQILTEVFQKGWRLQQPGLGEDEESPLCWCGLGSLVSPVDSCCPIRNICKRCKCNCAAGGWQGWDECQLYIQRDEVGVEMDHNKIKFQRACLLCLLPHTYEEQEKLPTISLQGFISLPCIAFSGGNQKIIKCPDYVLFT